MKPETKLKLRKWAIPTLRWIVWHVDEWLHRQELQLRHDLEFRAKGGRGSVGIAVTDQAQRLGHASPAERSKDKATVPVHRETFQQWEARRSGIAVISKKEARRRKTAAEFDLRFAR